MYYEEIFELLRECIILTLINELFSNLKLQLKYLILFKVRIY